MSPLTKQGLSQPLYMVYFLIFSLFPYMVASKFQAFTF